MKKYSCFLLVLFFILFSIKSFSQYDAKVIYLAHKAKIASLQKQQASFKRDTLILLEMDSLIKAHGYVPFFDTTGYNNINVQFKFWKNLGQKVKWKKGIALYNAEYGLHLTHAKKTIEGLKHLLLAEKDFESLNDKKNQVYSLISTSVLFTYFADSLSPLPYLDKAIKIARATNDTLLIRHTLNYKGDYYIINNRYDKAFPLYYEISKFKKLDRYNSTNYWTNDLYLGLCYLELNQEQKGLKMIYDAYKDLPTELHYYVYLHITIREYMIKYFLSKKRYLDAKRVVNEIEDLTKSSESFKYFNHIELYNFKYQYNKGLGNYKEALSNLEDLKVYNNMFLKDDIKNRIAGIKSQLTLKEQTEKLQKSENEKLKSDNERQKQFRWFLITISVIGLLSTIYVFFTNKKLKNSNSQLLEKNKEISQALLKGQTIERQRVAADLHDNLGSTLSALWLSVDTIDKSKMNDEEREIHQNLRENLEKAYNDVRLLSHNLLPEEFEKQGLTTILQGFARKMNKNSTIKFDLKIAENFGRVDNKVEFEIYCIA